MIFESINSYMVILFQNVYVNITRILSMAQRLCDAGHYAQNTIRIQAAKLEREWKSLAAALDDRSTVLSMSVMFHKKAETVSFWICCFSFGCFRVPESWGKKCRWRLVEWLNCTAWNFGIFSSDQIIFRKTRSNSPTCFANTKVALCKTLQAFSKGTIVLLDYKQSLCMWDSDRKLHP